MTKAQRRLILAALTRAADEWEAEAEHEEDYGYGNSTLLSRQLRRDLVVLQEARDIFVSGVK